MGYLSYVPTELNFGTSGLRALVTDMTDLECYINTLAFLRFSQDRDDSFAKAYLAGDLRSSTPRIMKTVAAAIEDADLEVVYCGHIPTPALAFAAQENNAPGIMVTGSHIPDDRNGIKFYKVGGEVLKTDEAAIKAQVKQIRAGLDDKVLEQRFHPDGSLKRLPELPSVEVSAENDYESRHTEVFATNSLEGKKVVLYQHSAVGRDLIQRVLTKLGAEVVPVGRSETFVPIDTENVTENDKKYFRKLAEQHPGCFAIVSTDGDSDRPFVVDHEGTFHRGDVLGAVVAESLGADFAAYPISTSDAVDTYFEQKHIPYAHTRIGSPYVIAAMDAQVASGRRRVVGWEVNGGFLVAQDMKVNDQPIKKLATRDALFPILVILTRAADEGITVQQLFEALPKRATDAGMIDGFPVEISGRIVDTYAQDTDTNRRSLEEFFTSDDGFGRVTKIDSTDGVRIYFDSGDIAHIRPSGNAPQLRLYSVSDQASRAHEIVSLAVADPNGILRQLENKFTAKN